MPVMAVPSPLAAVAVKIVGAPSLSTSAGAPTVIFETSAGVTVPPPQAMSRVVNATKPVYGNAKPLEKMPE